MTGEMQKFITGVEASFRRALRRHPVARSDGRRGVLAGISAVAGEIELQFGGEAAEAFMANVIGVRLEEAER